MSALAKLHIAKKDLQLEDADYRDILQRITGQRSAKGLDDHQIGRVLDELKAKGWKPQPPRLKALAGGKAATAPKRAADHPVAKKARALWISLWQLGVVRDPSEAALEAFACRQLGCERLQWADQGQGHKLIEALKAMAERAGWPQGTGFAKGEQAVYALKLELLHAQARILGIPNNRTDYTTDALDRDIAERGRLIRQGACRHDAEEAD